MDRYFIRISFLDENPSFTISETSQEEAETRIKQLFRNCEILETVKIESDEHLKELMLKYS